MNFSSIFIENAVNEFSKLPGIGKKTALRLVLHLIKNSKEEVKQFSTTFLELKEHLKECKICCNVSDDEICSICANSSRNQSMICVVESIREVMAIENTNQYNGTYHVLGGVISPINGIGPEQLNIDKLKQRVAEQDSTEIIMALNPNIDGDTTTFFISRQLKGIQPEITITTIARGVAFGGELEYVDEITLARSLATRLPFDNYLANQ